MFPNYCDFGYWDYGYAVGDTKSIQAAEGSIASDGNVIAVAGKTTFSAGVITANGVVETNGIRQRTTEGLINSAGLVFADGIRLRTTTQNITAAADFVANANGSFGVAAIIAGYGNASVSAKYSVNVRGSINGSADVAAILYRVGEEWSNVAQEPGTWTDQQFVGNTWSTISVPPNTWTDIPSSSNTWSTQSIGSNEWQLRG